MEVMALYAEITDLERDACIRNFNNPKSKVKVLIALYLISGIGNSLYLVY